MDSVENYDEERSTNIKDMVLSLKRNFKQICLGAIVICALFTTYKFIKYNKEMSVDNTPGATLTDNQKNDVKDIYAIYEQTLTTKKLLVAKAKNSALSQIDIENAYGIVSTYSVETDINNVLDYYGTINSFSDEERQEIIASSDLDENTTNLSDLVSVNVSKNNEDAAFFEVGKKFVLVVSVYSNSKESCEKIESIVETHIQNKTASIDAILQKLDSVSGVDTSYITNEQVKLSEDLNSVTTKLADLKSPKNLSDAEKSYYQYLLSGSETIEVSKNSFSFMKNGIVGIGIGLVVLIIIYAILYMFSNKVHATEDFTSIGLDILGFLDDGSEKLLNTNIVSYMNLHKLNCLFLNIDCEKSFSRVNNLVEGLDKSGIKVIIGNALKNNDDLEKMLNCDSVILVETAESSMIEDVIKMVQTVNRQQIHMIGYIMIK